MLVRVPVQAAEDALSYRASYNRSFSAIFPGQRVSKLAYGGIVISGQTYLVWLLVAYNALACALMGYDKYQAYRHRWRVPEKTLFAVALTGGSLGILAGMFIFHHKTRHWSFKLGIPAILVLQLGLLWFYKF